MKKYTFGFLVMLTMAATAFASVSPLNKSAVTDHLTAKKKLNNIRICALRVEFQEDDNELTSGNGKFLYQAETHDTLCSKFKVDPVPHNRAYFRDHLQALTNYYKKVSNGHLTIDVANSEVYPPEDSKTYTVAHKMDYYHPFLKDDSVDVRLAELIIEAVLLADEDVNFADYDAVVIFHAGVGQDFAFDLDPTPYDIPSAYMNQSDIQKVLSDNSDGIVVDNGNTLVTEGIILPETQNHILYENWEDVFLSDEPFDYQIGLNGTFVLQFGFFLGIPAMFNTETGDAGIGRWGMMDQGSVNLNGLVPPLPNAWVRQYMGWVEPVEAKRNVDIKLSHAESTADTLIWKIPIDDDEYFLVENRHNFLRPFWNLDSIRNRKYDELDDDEAPFPSIMPLIRDSIGAVFSDETGVLLSLSNYDVSLPGSGLLIYHIDETVIANNIETNSINNEKTRRGVSLEEADGAEDIGFPVENIFSDVSNSWGYDAWFNTNEGFWELNDKVFAKNDSTFIGFYDETYPNTRSNDLVYTGIKIDSIGAPGEVMHFTIAYESKTDNFPIAFENLKNFTKQGFLDIDNDGNEEILLVSDKMYIYRGDGTLVWEIDFDENIQDLQLLTQQDQAKILHQSDGQYYYSIYKFSNNGENYSVNVTNLSEIDEVIDFIEAGEYSIIAVKTGDDFGLLDVDNNRNIDIDGKIVKIGSDGNFIYTLKSDGSIDIYESDLSGKKAMVSFSENADNMEILSMALGYIDDGDVPDVVFSTANKLMLVKNAYSDERETLSVEMELQNDIIISDVNGDGRNDIITGNDKNIMVMDENLLFLPNFPFQLPNLYADSKFEKTLLTANLDNDDKNREVLAFIQGRGLLAVDDKGKLVADFPKATQTPFNEMLGCYNYKGKTDFISVSNNQINSIGISDDSLTEKDWAVPRFNSYFYAYKSSETINYSGKILNQKKTFCWPNPATENVSHIRYFVTQNCKVTVNIFDIAGNFVKSFSNDQPYVDRYNEFDWNISDVQSGVYYAFLKAKQGGKTENKTVKIMVIK